MTDTKSEGAKGTNVPAPQQQRLSANKTWEEITEQVIDYFTERQKAGLVLPDNYLPSNAILAAKLHLQELKDKDGKLIIDQVTKVSLVKALSKMVVSGLNVFKKQCYFIKYGDELTCQEDYRGRLMIAKRDAGVLDCNGQVVYKGDEFEYIVDTKTGRKQLTKHIPKFENQEAGNILGAYAIVSYSDGTSKLEVMTLGQIKDSWGMGAAKGNSPAHTKFDDQMAIKTVMNRAIKIDTGSSDDSEVMGDLQSDPALAARQTKVIEKGNKKELNASDIAYEDINTPVARQKSQTPVTPAEASQTGTAPTEELFSSENKPDY
jgi:recombination protein RecT